MGLEVVNRKYFNRWSANSNSFLFGNSAQRITERIDIVVDFDFTSSVSNQIIIDSPDTIKLNGGDWGGLGFLIGDTVGLTLEATNSDGGTVTASGATKTIANIDGDLMQFTNNVVPFDGYVGIAFPTQGTASVMEITNSTRTTPQELDFYHNLQLNDQNQSDFSVIDGEVNRFISENTDNLTIGDSANLVQLGNKSGGTYDNATIERLANSGTKAQYRIELEYLLPDVQDGDFEKPDWFDSDNCLKSTGKILCYPETNNPNSELSASYDNRLGNSGWFDEEHNQGVNDFTIDSVSLKGSTGNTLNELDHNQTCEITAVITGSSNFDDQVEGKISVIPQTSEFKNNEFKLAQNTYTSTFFKDGASAVVLNSYVKESREITTTGHSVDVSIGNQITVLFNFVPNSDFTNYINSHAKSDRRYRVVLSVQSAGGTQNDNNNVSLILKQGLFQKEPLPDVAFSGVVSKEFFNHSQDLDTGLGTNILGGCTEDDFVYKARINLEKNTTYLAIKTDIEVVRDSDGASFSLLNKTLPLGGFLVSNDGTQNIDYTEQLNQYLDSTGRNLFDVQNTANSTATTYEVQILWSLYANWMYWIENNNALSDFIDTNVPNNGLNAEWMRYLREVGYSLRLIVRLQTEEQNFFFENEIQLQDYEANLETPEINTDIIYIDQDGTIQSALLENQLMTVRADHTLISGSWSTTNLWGWISQRPFEIGPNKRISTVWDWTNKNLPLKPKTGLNKAELTFPTADVARIEAVVDTSLIDVENISFISRIQSPVVDDANITFKPFIFEVDVSIEAKNGTDIGFFELPMNGSGYDAIVDWGDGSIDSVTTSTNIVHEYTEILEIKSTYIIKVYYDFPRIYFNNTGDVEKVIDIIQWGDIEWKDMSKSFWGCINLRANLTATDAPDLGAATSLSLMWQDCVLLNTNFEHWNTATITEMTRFLRGASAYNQQIVGLDTSNVVSMATMLGDTTTFNKNINTLDVSSASDLGGLCLNASAFNQNLGDWQLRLAGTNLSFIFFQSGMSTANYTDTIVGWANYVISNAGTPNGVLMDGQTGMTFTNARSGGANFADAAAARAYLTGTAGWTISGDTIV